MTELWSGQQHVWLEALGHRVHVLGALPEAPEPVARQAPGAAVGSQRVARQAPARPVASPAPARRAAAPAAGGLAPDRLHIALIRASGCNPNAPGAEQIMAGWPSAAELRGNPAAKRALWPRLRALRRPGSP